MEFLRYRNQSIDLIINHSEENYILINNIFMIIDKCINIANENIEDSYFRICGLTIVKAKFVALGCFSLILDELGQEAGALLRPLLEYIELLTYYNQDPERITEAISSNLPSAGAIGKKINGKFQFLRDYCNQFASHVSYEPYTMAHLLNKDSLSLLKIPAVNPNRINFNLKMITSFIIMLGYESINCIMVKEQGKINEIAAEMDKLKAQFFELHPTNLPPEL